MGKKVASIEIFNQLNKLRIKNGKKPYKSCKESKKIMFQKIEKEKSLDNKRNEKIESANEEQMGVFKLSDLARELGLNPKNVRRTLRGRKDLPPTITANKWMFDNKYKSDLLTILKPRR